MLVWLILLLTIKYRKILYKILVHVSMLLVVKILGFRKRHA